MQHFHSIIFQDLKRFNWISITSTSFVRSVPTLYIQEIVNDHPVITVVALYDYEEEGENLLHFHQGDIITIIGEEGQWCEGYTENGEQGWFPADYVEIVKE